MLTSRPTCAVHAVCFNAIDFNSEHEASLKKRWLGRLSAIRTRASQHTLVPPLPVTMDADLQEIGLGKRAWRTIRGHVRRFEGWEAWASSAVFPVTIATLLPYLVSLYRRQCGLTVIPTMVTTVTWILRRLRLPPLPLPEPAFEAVRGRALQSRGAEVRVLKEAVPVPMEIVIRTAQSDPVLANGVNGTRKHAIR